MEVPIFLVHAEFFREVFPAKKFIGLLTFRGFRQKGWEFPKKQPGKFQQKKKSICEIKIGRQKKKHKMKLMINKISYLHS